MSMSALAISRQPRYWPLATEKRACGTPFKEFPYQSRRKEDAIGLEALGAPTLPAPRRRTSSSPKFAQGHKDERTVTTTCLKPDTESGLQRPRRL